MPRRILNNAILGVLAVITATSDVMFSLAQEDPVEYGVDVSFPIQSYEVSTNYPWLPHNVDPENNPTPPKYQGMPIQLLGNVKERYDNMIKGCGKAYPRPKGICEQTERDRVEMSIRQPHQMQNYTDNGFKKIRTPPGVWKLISEFWEKNKENYMKQKENWPKGNTYVNHWDSPTYMISIEDGRLRGGGQTIKQAVWDAAKETIQEWTGEELTQCSLYGIRVYTEGAMLATHVDRMPLVSSAIVNVAQDLDEPWPIEVIGHDGKAHNVTMEPGDMVLYESHSVLHGRPFPMKGRFYANIFIHFEPTGHSLRHDERLKGEAGKDVHREYRKSVARGSGGHEADHSGLPPYILPGSEEETKWKSRHPDNRRSEKARSDMTGSTAAHQAAQTGDVEGLTEVLEVLGDLVNKADSNGWTPLHEGARAGHLQVVEILVENGGGINDKTRAGETPLYLAERDKQLTVAKFLRSLGAISLGPEL
uniref:Fe2OG dioxygenase domain-containing protein n=1 Tax=Chaetoceros debilis TaxID=122233 RepID=A0A7S3QBB7_9STRA|mmetsp:Transcript_17585/g.25778  ORF Transcript_17585/g.25778 Transcript_17585/m.25778 type:complete len:477 (-) Transcript_17585:174-1604(-)|eukprot:CAMPEP_0194076864 /NCGR_PEP_ID=MMETSP0149-20130528/3614_1 /TAXON_ID=122233 /ORGANISM="Chaetoceros debilis, Strain MM31A-1" /LENGTH=476 /DNA_ID=CAMNT_0038757741 /DNA_START=114 /DNA_END=1544 /DNA_ORIENTATION=-